jgi:nucleoside-diphosphate-sugar epimerase
VKLLVTGATGFLGSHVAELLLAEGHRVRVLLRHRSNREFLQGLACEEAIGDISDPPSLTDAVSGVDAVIHTAGLVKARTDAEFLAVNAAGTANLLTAIEQGAPGLRRFVHVSTLAAHGPSEDGSPRPLDAPPRPITAYGRSKLAGEDFTRASAVADRAVIFRPPAIYGPRDPALVPFFRLARWRLAPLLMGGHNRVSLVYVEDAARAIVTAATAEADVAGKTYTLDDGGVYSWRDLMSAVEAATGHRTLRLNCPRWTFTAAALASEAFGLLSGRAVSLTRDKVSELAQPHWVCSHQALNQDTGWTPAVDIQEGARRTADWYRRHRWI